LATSYFHPLPLPNNHLTQSTNDAATLPSTEYEANEVVRGALQGAVNNYISTNYPSEQSAGGAFTKDENTYVVVVTGEKTSLKNFWSGRWTSTWNIAVSGSTASISGDIKVSFLLSLLPFDLMIHCCFFRFHCASLQLHVHYFEDGNLQLQSGKHVPANSLSFSSETELAAEVVKFIQVGHHFFLFLHSYNPALTFSV